MNKYKKQEEEEKKEEEVASAQNTKFDRAAVFSSSCGNSGGTSHSHEKIIFYCRLFTGPKYSSNNKIKKRENMDERQKLATTNAPFMAFKLSRKKRKRAS